VIYLLSGVFSVCETPASHARGRRFETRRAHHLNEVRTLAIEKVAGVCASQVGGKLGDRLPQALDDAAGVDIGERSSEFGVDGTGP
jgi:hypothetical protein